MRAGEFPPRVVRLVFEVRDGESCFNCGRGLLWHERGTGWSMHHRRARGMGGTKETWVGQPGNALTLCGSGTTGCHGWVETHRDTAYEHGLLVRRHSLDLPVNVPVRNQAGVWFWLTDWGSRIEVGEDVKF